MALSAGTRLWSDEILSAIGASGVGKVCQAHDTKLGRRGHPREYLFTCNFTCNDSVLAVFTRGRAVLDVIHIVGRT